MDVGRTEVASQDAHLTIRSPRLKVEIAKPGTVYRGSRFDWTAFITQVTLDGATTFCVPEALKGGTGGIGLCSEFAMQTAVAFESAKVGEPFIKPGVGLCTRVDERPYQFNRPVPVSPFPMHVESTDSTATFTVEPVAVRGYAMKQVKTVRVVDDQLSVEASLTNVGEHLIDITEYNHNFVALNNRPPSAGTRVILPFKIKPVIARGDLLSQDGEIAWIEPMKTWFHRRFQGFDQKGNFSWKWEDKSSGHWMTETTDQAWLRFAIWGTSRVLSPEVFLKIEVARGETKTWTRTWRFGRG